MTKVSLILAAWSSTYCNSKLIVNINSEEDVFYAQEAMENVYKWAEENNMSWNNTKFQVLRLGKNSEIKENTSYFSPNFSNLVEEVEVVRDLGIHIDNDLSYDSHRSITLQKVWKKWDG